MSCCGGNCKCGADCKCGSGCKMYTDMSEATDAATQTIVLGVATQKTYLEESDSVVGVKENGCKCGPNCSCNPCNCK